MQNCIFYLAGIEKENLPNIRKNKHFLIQFKSILFNENIWLKA